MAKPGCPVGGNGTQAWADASPLSRENIEIAKDRIVAPRGKKCGGERGAIAVMETRPVPPPSARGFLRGICARPRAVGTCGRSESSALSVPWRVDPRRLRQERVLVVDAQDLAQRG